MALQPWHLSWSCMVPFVLLLFRRGRECWTSMTNDTFVFEQDAEGHEYVVFAKTETTKNHQGGYKQRDIDYLDQIMYGPGVEILKYLLGKLHPDYERLFQHPLVAFISDAHCFKKEPMGENMWGNIMQRISGKARLSMRYTCHCVRASTITIIYRAGIDTPSIMSISANIRAQQDYFLASRILAILRSVSARPRSQRFTA